MIKLFFTLYLLLVFYFKVYAQENSTYFDFKLPKKLLYSNIDYSIDLEFDISHWVNGRFTVLPILKGGSIAIWDYKDNAWKNGETKSYHAPLLHEDGKIKFKIISFPNVTGMLSFVIFDQVTGQRYSTPDKKVWSDLVARSYLSRLVDRAMNVRMTR